MSIFHGFNYGLWLKVHFLILKWGKREFLACNINQFTKFTFKDCVVFFLQGFECPNCNSDFIEEMGPHLLRHMTEQGTEMDTPNLTEVSSLVSVEVYVKIDKLFA